MTSGRRVILTLVRHYLPGYKAGGPLRTLSNMVDQLGGEFDFRIITSDRDLGDSLPFPGIDTDKWIEERSSRILYLAPEAQSFTNLARIIAHVPHDALYLHSYFEPVFTLEPLVARRLGRLPPRPTILAPRGELSEGALALKPWKKKTFIAAARALRLHKGVIWQASSALEQREIELVTGAPPEDIVVAPDLPAPPSEAGEPRPANSTSGPLRICFVSRISRKKNLDVALRILETVRTPVLFDIFGPREDDEYWLECEELMSLLPSNVQARYCGVIDHSSVEMVFARYDLFLFPTAGENFGHVVIEAMSAGTPVLVSDTTPWRDLEKLGVGWDFPLEQPAAFAGAIERLHRMGPGDRSRQRQKVRAYARDRATDRGVVEANLRLFETACAAR